MYPLTNTAKENVVSLVIQLTNKSIVHSSFSLLYAFKLSPFTSVITLTPPFYVLLHKSLIWRS
uniref:Uncharacterized protein n=1 Tax=Octopus bimaculoides TaxID=37653 RepID=A0A0L8HEQ2_OCTBM